MAWPTKQDPRDKVVTLRMTEDEVIDLDLLVAALNSDSRSDTIREALSLLAAKPTIKANLNRARAAAAVPTTPADSTDSTEED